MRSMIPAGARRVLRIAAAIAAVAAVGAFGGNVSDASADNSVWIGGASTYTQYSEVRCSPFTIDIAASASGLSDGQWVASRFWLRRWTGSSWGQWSRPLRNTADDRQDQWHLAQTRPTVPVTIDGLVVHTSGGYYQVLFEYRWYVYDPNVRSWSWTLATGIAPKDGYAQYGVSGGYFGPWYSSAYCTT